MRPGLRDRKIAVVGFQEPGGRIVATLTEEIVSRTASSDRGALDASAINGVDVSRGGELIFEGPHQITGNGNPTNGSGIRVERSSLSLQNGATVSNNIGTDIFGGRAQWHSSRPYCLGDK